MEGGIINDKARRCETIENFSKGNFANGLKLKQKFYDFMKLYEYQDEI
jgi:hypothetical protein